MSPSVKDEGDLDEGEEDVKDAQERSGNFLSRLFSGSGASQSSDSRGGLKFKQKL